MDRIETILKKGGDGSLYLEDRRTEVIETTQFSKRRSIEYRHRVYLDQDRSLNVIDYEYHLGVCPRGHYYSSEGPVLLGFNLYPRKPFYCRNHDQINCRAEWTNLVSIVDSEGCLRYPQSLTRIYDGVERQEDIAEWIQVVSAHCLQREADVLLPDDTLTVQVDMVLKQYYTAERCKHKHIVFDELLDWSFEMNSSNGVFIYQRLRLDSPLGELLREESRFFERLCATPMAEKNSGYLDIPEEEEETFLKMVKILSYPHVQLESSFDLNATIKDILDIYRISHFYGIEKVLGTLRCWLILICLQYAPFLTEEEISAIPELGDTYDDSILKGIVGALRRKDMRPICLQYAPFLTEVNVSAISELVETYDDPILREFVEALTRSKNNTAMQRGVDSEPWTCTLLAREPANKKQLFSFKKPEKIKKKEHMTEDVSALSDCYI